MKKLIIFDLDGTLIDTLDDLKNAVNYALINHGFPVVSKEHTRISIGNGVQKLIARCISQGESNPLYKDTLNTFIEYYSKHSEDLTKPYIGIKDVCLKLKKDGYKLAVCTNKVNDIANKMIRKMFDNIFDIIQGDQPPLRKKPYPDMIDKIISTLGYSKEETIYVGDTNVDEETAISSNLDYILVSYGYRTKDELLSMTKSRVIVDTMDELYNELKSRV